MILVPLLTVLFAYLLRYGGPGVHRQRATCRANADVCLCGSPLDRHATYDSPTHGVVTGMDLLYDLPPGPRDDWARLRRKT